MLLEVKNLQVNYKQNNAIFECLKAVNFSVTKGEIIGIVGESGCGKSTLAKALVSMLNDNGKVVAGEILYDKKDILLMTKKEKIQLKGTDIGIIFQDSMNSLNPLRNIKSQFIEVLMKKKNISKYEAIKRMKKILSLMNINDIDSTMKKYPFQLSGGQKQRIAIAMSFALEPKILIADEPTTALDVTVQAQVITEMNKLSKLSNVTIILISHNLGVISQLCDRTLVMYNGRIVEEGITSEILNNPKHLYTKGLIKCIPDLNIDKNKKLYVIDKKEIEVYESNRVKTC